TRQAYTGVVADGMRKWSTEDCASIRCAPPRSALKTCAENKPLLSFLLTNGAHVRVRTGEPLCFSNATAAGERCESANQMKIQWMHGKANRASSVHFICQTI